MTSSYVLTSLLKSIRVIGRHSSSDEAVRRRILELPRAKETRRPERTVEDRLSILLLRPVWPSISSSVEVYAAQPDEGDITDISDDSPQAM